MLQGQKIGDSSQNPFATSEIKSNTPLSAQVRKKGKSEVIAD
jgi:hypothetical protein